jgi:hypothetical protein
VTPLRIINLIGNHPLVTKFASMKIGFSLRLMFYSSLFRESGMMLNHKGLLKT